MSPTRTQSSNSVQSARDRTASIEEYGDHSRLPPIANSSLQRNEAPIAPVPKAPADVHHVRFDLDVNQPNSTSHDQCSSSLRLDRKDPTEAGAKPSLDIPLDDERPPGSFNWGSVSRVNTHLPLDIPLDGKPPGSFNWGSVSRVDTHPSLDIPLHDERPPGPFNRGSVPSAPAELSLDFSLDGERPPGPFNRSIVSRPATLDIGEGNNQDRQASDFHLQNERPPSPFNHGSFPMRTHYAKPVINTSHGRPSNFTPSFVSLTPPLFP